MEKRDVGIAYLLLLTFGLFGAHRYYLGRTGSAVTMTVFAILVLPVSVGFTVAGLTAQSAGGLVVGFLLWLTLGVWWVVDLFLTAGMVQEFNNGVQAHRNAVATGADRMTAPSDRFIPKHDPRAWAENAVVQGRHRA